MIFIDELFYGNLSGGTLDGACAICLEIGAERKVSLEALIKTILTFGRTKVFKISGNYEASNKDDLFALLSTLKENGYLTVGVFDGKKKEEWMEHVAYRIINITEGPWLMYGASEIHFQPIAKEDLEPPFLSEAHTKSTCYLDVNRDLAASEVFEFLKKYSFWRIFSPPSKVYRMTVSIRDEE